MKSGRTTQTITAAIVVIASLSWASQAAAQRGAPPKVPLPQGQQLTARDGDVVTVEDDARVRIVRRRQAVIRLIFNPTDRSVIVLVDHVAPAGADGRVDSRHSYSGLSGQWPVAERWEGTAVIEEYAAVGQPTQGVGLLLPQGLIQILGPTASEMFADPGALAVLGYRGSSGGTGGGVDFDEAERRQLSDVAGRGGRQSSVGQGRAPEPQVSLELTAVPQPEAGVRVGSGIRSPRKIYDVAPVYPERARQASIAGTVLLELTVGSDGAVTAAKVLRSVELLDQAAIAAARQWRYEPELLNGEPVPFVVTAPVVFKR